MLFQLKTLGFSHGSLALFNLGIVKLFYPAAIETHQMVMVRAFVELVDCFAALKITACEQPGLFKLREYAVDSRQADIGTLAQQHTVHIFRRHVPLLARLKNLHDFQARQRRFKAGTFEFVKRGHNGSAIKACGVSRYNGLIITFSACGVLALPFECLLCQCLLLTV
jgi:hypothetical protein